MADGGANAVDGGGGSRAAHVCAYIYRDDEGAAPGYAEADASTLRLLLLPFASDGIGPHFHRACGHLSGLLKLVGNPSVSNVAPPFRLPLPLPGVFRFSLRTSKAPKFHFAPIF